MASNFQESSNIKTNSFVKGLNKDTAESYIGEGMWTHARNAVNNTNEGHVGYLGNEPANKFCSSTPYPIIAALYDEQDKWYLFSTDDVNSEIGLFRESTCTYEKVVNAPCLNFKRTNLIKAAIKSNADCTTSLYWDDGINPTRVLNVDRIPYKEIPKSNTIANTCYVPQYSNELDCEALRLAPLMTTPCLRVIKSKSGGTMPNGSYQVAIAYSIAGIKVTDYFLPSNIQSLFTHADNNGALEVEIDSIDLDFDEFELVLISYVKENLTARIIGYYSTRTTKVSIDKLDPALKTVGLDLIPLITPAYEKSDNLLSLNDYLIRIGIYTKPDFNYQPQANKILTKWVAVEQPADYYIKGGNQTSYLRDEVYSFFIRWVYNTGEKSASYHIPGRASVGRDISVAGGRDAIENQDNPTVPAKRWEVFDTSNTTSRSSSILPNNEGKVVAEGTMGYWESTEKYPDDKPQIWGDLCGKPIRHHKMPDNSTSHIYNTTTNSIVLLGVKFENITHPLDNNGVPLESVVGYEILRGSREGNKTVIAKGILSNMGEYEINPDITSRKGLYQNYPFNDLNIDPFLSKKEVKGGCQGKGYEPMGTFLRDMFSFHSPDTQFRDPYLNPYEVKIHGEYWGNAEGKFTVPYKHPKHKLLRDFALFIAGIVGTGIGLTSLLGKKTSTTTINNARGFNLGLSITGQPTGTSGSAEGVDPLFVGPLLPLNELIKKPSVGPNANFGGYNISTDKSVTQEQSPFDEIPTLAAAQKTLTFLYFMGEGMENALRIIKQMVSPEQYAYQYDAHGFYNNYIEPTQNNRRRKLIDAQYINPYIQDFGLDYRINNLFRGRYVILQTNGEFDDPTTKDNSRVTIGGLKQYSNPTASFKRTISSHYASLKIKMPSQYGQLDGVLQVPVSSCVHFTNTTPSTKFTSPVLFGGDVYINRYTEKNSFCFFNDWLIGQPNEYPFNYMEHVNITYPRYWMNSNEYDSSVLIQPFVNTVSGALIGNAIGRQLSSLFNKTAQDKKIFGNVTIKSFLTTLSTIAGAGSSAAISINSWKNNALPNDFMHLDRLKSDCLTGKIGFGVKNGYFYLFANGVKDFFVESEINLAQRDYGENDGQRHYDQYTYTDLQYLFRSDLIKAGNYYKYDYSLSASRMFQNNISWGTVLPKDYDPEVASSCYSYYSSRAIYSLPTQKELKKDNWRVFLANNYYDFSSTVVSMKSINQSGSIILFKNASPDFFAGVDQLQTTNGVKVTIGDGGLFGTPMQAASNAEYVYEYGSCQNSGAVLNTPMGLFWVSQNQGRVFYFAQGLQEISNAGLKWWFAKYLPSYLLKSYPDFELSDNPILGVGVQLTYDNINNILYLCKKDYKVRDEYASTLVYHKANIFKIGATRTIYLGDPLYFEDASFTVSYDVKSQSWISFHDWHPDLVLPSKSHFLTTKGTDIYRHNDRCDLFCNFYGVNYPFEVEFVSSTGQEVATLKSVEYQLECYKYDGTCQDKNHILDWNFDRAVIHNTEQTSGNLRLVLKPKNDPIALIEYPIVKSSNIDILYSKEENKYRFNQFWDVTRNRGEFITNYQPIWETAANGYERELNDRYVNYQKTSLQHKKIRHYLNKILLKRMVSDDVKMLFRLSNQKMTKSFR